MSLLQFTVPGAVTVGQNYAIFMFTDPQSQVPPQAYPNIPVTITEAGLAPFGYLAGTFAGTFTNGNGPVTINGSFRALRPY